MLQNFLFTVLIRKKLHDKQQTLYILDTKHQRRFFYGIYE